MAELTTSAVRELLFHLSLTIANGSSSSNNSINSGGGLLGDSVGDDDSVDGSDNNHALLYFIGGSLSACFCFFLMSTYFLFPHLRHHPSQIATYRALCDFVFNLGFIFVFLIGEPSGDSNSCLVLSLSNQFSAFASNGWYLILSIDLFKAIRNPFFVPQDSMKSYHAFVWLTALSTSIILGVGGRWGYSLFDFCWIRVAGPSDLNTYSWALFYIPVMIFYFVSLFVVIFASYALKRGLPESHEIRKRVLTQGRRYVFQFFLYWTFAGSVWAAQYIFVSETSQKEYPLIVIFSLTIAFRGLADAVILVWSSGLRPKDYLAAIKNLFKRTSSKQKKFENQKATRAHFDDSHTTSLTAPLLDGGSQQPSPYAAVSSSSSTPVTATTTTATSIPDHAGPNVSINLTLRKEIMLCTTWGIVATVKDHHRITHPLVSTDGYNNISLQNTAPSSPTLENTSNTNHNNNNNSNNTNGDDDEDNNGAVVDMYASSYDVLTTERERTTSMRSVIKFHGNNTESSTTPVSSASISRRSHNSSSGVDIESQQLIRQNSVKNQQFWQKSSGGDYQRLDVTDSGAPSTAPSQQGFSSASASSSQPDYYYQQQQQQQQRQHSAIDSSGLEFSLDFGEITQSHMKKRRGEGGFDFRDYMPSVFDKLRSLFGTSSSKYLSSFVAKDELKEEREKEMLEKFTEGRSGSFFYFCQDMRYIVKTVTSADLGVLKKFLPHYFAHVVQNPDSLLARFCGLHAIRLSREQEWIHFVVMENSIFTKLKLHERYDMKGSWIARRSLKEGISVETVGTMKDTDFVNLGRKVHLGAHRRAKILQILEADARFLESLGIMDYSLLLAIHKQDPTSSVVQAAVAQAKENEASGIIPTKSSSSSAGAASSTATTADGHDPLNVSHISKVSVTSTSTSGGDLIRKHASFYHYDHGGMQGIDAAAPCLYFLGIIDILQEYDFSKKLEHFAKSKLLCKDSHGISAVEPEEYRERFITAMESVFV